MAGQFAPSHWPVLLTVTRSGAPRALVVTCIVIVKPRSPTKLSLPSPLDGGLAQADCAQLPVWWLKDAGRS